MSRTTGAGKPPWQPCKRCNLLLSLIKGAFLIILKGQKITTRPRSQTFKVESLPVHWKCWKSCFNFALNALLVCSFCLFVLIFTMFLQTCLWILLVPAQSRWGWKGLKKIIGIIFNHLRMTHNSITWYTYTCIFHVYIISIIIIVVNHLNMTASPSQQGRHASRTRNSRLNFSWGLFSGFFGWFS